MSSRFVRRVVIATAAVTLAGCCSVAPLQTAPEPAEQPAPKKAGNPPAADAHLAAFSADLVGTDRSTPGRTTGVGRLVAVYDHKTSLLRWKLAFSGLKGAPKAGHFRGADKPGASAATTLSFGSMLKSPMEGRANLSEAQAADLLSGRWYASVRTSAQPREEIRGQLVLHE